MAALQRTAVALAIGLAVLAAHAATPHAALEGQRFSSKQWGIRMRVPRTWNGTAATSYPNVLLWMSHRNPQGKMLLTAEPVKPGETAFTYAKRTASVLTKLGFEVRAPQPHGVSAFTVRFNNEHVFLRQALIVSQGTGYALTISAGSREVLRRHMRAFDLALGSIRLTRNGNSAK